MRKHEIVCDFTLDFVFFLCLGITLLSLYLVSCICICVCLTAATCCFNWATPTRAAAASAAGQIAIWRCDRQIMKCQESHLNDLMVRCRVPNAGELVNKQSTVAGLTCTRKLTHTHTHTRPLLWHLQSVCPVVVQHYDRSKYCLYSGYITNKEQI